MKRFEKDDHIVRVAPPRYGEYLTTYYSDHAQVRADMFRRGETVTAYVTYPAGRKNVTDKYWSDLREYAASHGITESFRIVLSSSDPI
jgi:hypothetical protein